MLLINCPFCGERDESEFSCGGEAHIARPLVHNKLSDTEFAEYLFLRDNPKGVFIERWSHVSGCRRWFNMVRDTLSHEIIEIYLPGDMPKTARGKQAYKQNWRRKTAAEFASKPKTSKPKTSKPKTSKTEMGASK